MEEILQKRFPILNFYAEKKMAEQIVDTFKIKTPKLIRLPIFELVVTSKKFPLEKCLKEDLISFYWKIQPLESTLEPERIFTKHS